jgi:serine protease Do
MRAKSGFLTGLGARFGNDKQQHFRRMAMRKHILTAIALLPLLLNPGRAAQRYSVDSTQVFGIPSEDSDANSYLGVDIANITSDRLGILKLKEEQGVEVTMVDQDAPAGKAGIKEHDVILTMNGTAVESKTQLQRMIHETPPGRMITLGLSRDGQAITIKVQLADRRNEFAQVWPKDKYRDKDFHVEIPPIPPIPNIPDIDIPNLGVVVVHSSMRSGVMVENLTPQLGEFFGAKSGKGVLVRSVEKGSRAEKAGLRAGDVITRVGDQPVLDTSDFTHALHTHSGGSVSLGVIRDKKEQTLTLTLPERRESGEMVEESLEMDEPELDADAQIDLSEVQDEIAKLRPEIELAVQQSRRAADEQCKALRSQQKELKEQAEKLSQELGSEVQEELQKNRERLQREMEQYRLEMRGDGLDI